MEPLIPPPFTSIKGFFWWTVMCFYLIWCCKRREDEVIQSLEKNEEIDTDIIASFQILGLIFMIGWLVLAFGQQMLIFHYKVSSCLG